MTAEPNTELSYEAYGFGNNAWQSTTISKAKFLEVKEASTVLNMAVAIEENISIVAWNLYEFEADLLTIAQKRVIWLRSEFTISMYSRLLLERRISNLLSSCRLFLDHAPHVLSKIFPNSEKEQKSFKEFRNILHSQNKGYRYMDAMRDYIQHRGLLIYRMTFRQDGTIGSYRQTIIPSSSLIELTDDKKLNKKIRKELGKELEAGTREIDLRPMIRDYIGCFIKLHRKLREIIEKKLQTSTALYKNAIAEYETISGVKCDVNNLSIRAMSRSGILIIDFVRLQPDLLDYYEKLVTENNSLRSPVGYSASNAFPPTIMHN